MKSLILAVFAATLAVAPAPAQSLAAGAGTQVVSYADLDLSSESGRLALDRRIRAAIDAACGTASSADPHGRRAVAACRSDLRAQADAQRGQALASADRPTVLASQR
jgi:UrcA family protein